MKKATNVMEKSKPQCRENSKLQKDIYSIVIVTLKLKICKNILFMDI